MASPVGFERCVRGSIRELYGYVALLTGHDRRAAEGLVGDVYRSLFRAVRAGQVDGVTLGALRAAGRELWLAANRSALLDARSRPTGRADTLADLDVLERAVVVFRHVNGMPRERVAAELDVDPSSIAPIESRAIVRLRGVDQVEGPWLRAYFGHGVVPASGLVDAIVHGLDPAVADAAPDGGPATEPMPMVPSSPPVGDDDIGDAAGESTEPVPVVSGSVQVGDDGIGDAAPEGPDGRRRGPVVVGAGIVAAGALAVGGWFVLRSDDGLTMTVASPSTTAVTDQVGETSEPTSTTAPPVATETTVPAPTTAPLAMPSTADVVIDGETSDHFDPPCVGRVGGAVVPPSAGPLPATFGPLGSEPSIVVSLPQSTAPGPSADPERRSLPARADVRSVGDGLLVIVRAAADHDVDDTIAAHLGFDGSLAWVRCFDEPVHFLAEPNDDIALAARRTGPGQREWHRVSLGDGSLGIQLSPVTGFALDLIDERRRDAAIADPWDESTLGSVVWDSGSGRAVLTGRDADGRTTWTDPSVDPPPGLDAAERPEPVVDDDLAVVNVCVDTTCGAIGVAAYDVESGSRRWDRPGEAAIVADGYALIGGDGWDLVDTSSGETVDGQRWDDQETFASRCCGESGDVAVTLLESSGIVVASHDDRLEIWLPAGHADGTTMLSVPAPS